MTRTAEAGWRLLGWEIDPSKTIDLESASTATQVIEMLGITSVQITQAQDVTGDWATWFKEEIGSEVVLVRPDFFVCDACAAKDIPKM